MVRSGHVIVCFLSSLYVWAGFAHLVVFGDEGHALEGNLLLAVAGPATKREVDIGESETEIDHSVFGLYGMSA